MEQEIINLIQKHYKTAKVYSVTIDGNPDSGEECYLTIECVAGRNYPNIARRILNTYPNIGYVNFTGGWIEAVYTRETLKLAGYKVK